MRPLDISFEINNEVDRLDFLELQKSSPNTVLRDLFDFCGEDWLEEKTKILLSKRKEKLNLIKSKYDLSKAVYNKSAIEIKENNKTTVVFNSSEDIKSIIDKDIDQLVILTNDEFHSFKIKDEKESILDRKLLKMAKRKTTDEKLDNKNIVSQVLSELLKYSKENKVSDIHLEPCRNEYKIRVKINGELIIWKAFQATHKELFVKRMKETFGLKTDIGNKVQDGSGLVLKYNLGFRSSLIPSIYGEAIVLRLIDMDFDPTIDNLGFSKSAEIQIKKIKQINSGIVLVSGPTGSGKSTTLYSILKMISTNNKKTVSIEDPVERRVDEVLQFEVNSKNTFGSILKGVLRHDPDSIFIGEIRDEESLKIAIQAAQTGHLVLASIHANSSLDVVPRMLDLNGNKNSIYSVLKLSISQRLYKVRCSSCIGSACPQCMGSGVIKRKPVIESSKNEDDNLKNIFRDEEYNEVIKCIS